MSVSVQTWQLRAQFASALSRFYAAEVPLFSTLVEVSAEVNRERGAAERLTMERDGAIRVGSPRELVDVADLFAAFGMYPVGFYDQRGIAMIEAMATADPAVVWGDCFPTADEEMAGSGLAYYRGGDSSKPVVYEDFLPASAAGIFRSNLDSDTRSDDTADGSHYSMSWMAGQIGHHIHDPYELYEKAASQ